ncbi:hypothetical protein COV16_04705 [Candidatus Woesearchaeota archaeon CG10_big_fil_rev_8_21_14_0_10_34_8]|nr:MAG: hypothetical protein COV16_04705 [Candidatus Woesearchaeota archaeon CG10_big_fil_rev_8_21_14_0_10_34_8]
MIEFNPDGSIKLPGRIAKQKEENTQKLRSQKCIKIERDVVNFAAPKKCVLHITLSDAITDNRFISNMYDEFKRRAAVPSKISKIDEKKFEVEIGTDFKRCTDCTSLINEYREFLYGNIIDKKGNCTFEGRKKNFCYEDHFD